MSDTEIIQLIRTEIREAFRQDREATIKDVFKRLRLDFDNADNEISQNQADMIIGKAARIKGKADGSIHFYNKSEGRWGRVMLNLDDVMRIKNRNKF